MNALVIISLAVVVAACSRERSAAPVATGSAQPSRAAKAGGTDAEIADALPQVIEPGFRDVITAIVPDWTSTTAELRLWRQDDRGWRLVLGPWRGVVGASGSAWGIGLHGSGAPDGRDGPIKREGDLKTPAGVFEVRKSYGYAYEGPSTSALDYLQVDREWKCIDDSKSRHYTRILNAFMNKRNADWSSAEDMHRDDGLYRWVIDIAHNPEAVPGAGSCIFLHVWGGPASKTAGCTAMEEPKMRELLARLMVEPLFVLLPRAEYDTLAPIWNLPRP